MNVGSPDVQKFDVCCVSHPPDPSTSESDLPVFEDIGEESKEDEEDQPSSDDPERSNQQHQLQCRVAQYTNVSLSHF